MTRLSERRRAADRYAAVASAQRTRLSRAIGVIDRRTRPYRSALVLGTGLVAGALSGLLPLRKTIRLASFSFNTTMVTRRLLAAISIGNPGRDDRSNDSDVTAGTAATTRVQTQQKGYQQDVP